MTTRLCPACHGQGCEPHECDDGRLVQGPACTTCDGAGRIDAPTMLVHRGEGGVERREAYIDRSQPPMQQERPVLRDGEIEVRAVTGEVFVIKIREERDA